MHQVSIEEAKTTLPDLIEAAVDGDEVLIAKDEQHIVSSCRFPERSPRRNLAARKG